MFIFLKEYIRNPGIIVAAAFGVKLFKFLQIAIISKAVAMEVLFM